MNRARLIGSAAGSAMAVVGLCAGLAVGIGAAPSSAATAAAPAASAAAGPHYVVLNCMNNDKAQVKPGVITLACADDGIGLQSLHWTSWTPEVASAYGTLWENNCTPSCAAGHRLYYKAVVMLWGSAAVKGSPGERRYTEATISFTTKSRPPVYVLKDGKLVPTYPVTETLPLNL